VDKTLSSFVSTRSPLWLAIYPEGTFVDASPKDAALVPAARQFCKDHNLPEHIHLLVDIIIFYYILMIDIMKMRLSIVNRYLDIKVLEQLPPSYVVMSNI
jgi:hypothetical protein